MNVRKSLLAMGVALSALTLATGAQAQQRAFDIAAGPAVKSIPEFARQAGVQIVAPADQLKGVLTPAISGAKDARDALKALIAGTGLEIASDDGAVISLRAKSVKPATPQRLSQNQDTSVVQSVTVTAIKRETQLMRTPVAVTAISRDALDRNGVKDVRELGDLVPAMQVGFSPLDSGVQVTIRGVTSNNFTELGDPAVGIHFDGVYSPRPQSGMTLNNDVSRVEVLRGPQGTLFGRNSTAGAINILANRPSFSGEQITVGGSLGNYNSKNLNFVFNQPVNDMIAVRVAFNGEKSDGYLDQVQDKYALNWPLAGFNGTGAPNTDQLQNTPVGHSRQYTAVNRWAARASVLFKPTANLSWLMTVERFEDQSPGNVAIPDCPKLQGTAFACHTPTLYTAINTPGIMNLGTDTYRSLVEYKPKDGLKLEWRASFTRERRAQQADGDGGANANPNDPAYGMAIRTCCGGANFGPLTGFSSNTAALIQSYGFNPANVAVFPFSNDEERTRWSRYDSLVNEIQLKSDGEGPLKWVAGLFDLREKNAIDYTVDQPWCCGAGLPLAEAFVQPDRRSITTAGFAQIDYAIVPTVNVTAGIRYNADEKSDKHGSNHETIGYWVNPGAFDAAGSWLESWGFVGPGTWVPNWTGAYPGGPSGSAWLTPSMGTNSPTFLTRTTGTDNTTKAHWTHTTWKTGFDWTMNDDLFVYGSIATGYKAGGFGDKVDVCNCGVFTSFPYKPETDINYELAAKARFFNRTLNTIFTIYDTQFSNMQKTGYAIIGQDASTHQYIGTELTTNLASARIRGAEFEVDWAPYRGGRVTGWVSWNDAIITKDPGQSDGFFCFQRAYLGYAACPALDANGNRPVSYVGHHLAWAPEWSATLNYEHNWYLADGLRLSPYVSAHWQSMEYLDDSNLNAGPFNYKQPGFVTVNLSLRLINEKDRWGLEAYVYNAGDQLIRAWEQPGPDYMKAAYWSPRTFGVRANHTF